MKSAYSPETNLDRAIAARLSLAGIPAVKKSIQLLREAVVKEARINELLKAKDNADIAKICEIKSIKKKKDLPLQVITFKATSQDIENLDFIQFDLEGATRSDCIRRAVEEKAGKFQRLFVKPAMVSERDFKVFLELHRSYLAVLSQAIQDGLPFEDPRATREDQALIKEARDRFKSAAVDVDLWHHKLVTFRRLVATLEDCDVERIKQFARQVATWQRNSEEKLSNPNLTDHETERIESHCRLYRSATAWFIAVGLILAPQ